ncbi:transglycosylase SLT domain-containing protein [Bartonella bilalgolemii]|nr:transglycosylase SLT domain-containing protein [Bartonella sp. G70]
MIPPHVKHAISQAAQKYGLPESFLQRVAMIESNGNPTAQNKNSSAGGLYQFLDSTAEQYRLKNKFDPFEATDAMARLTKDNTRYLQTALGRVPSEAELYLAHQQGPAGAARLIKNPMLPASQLLGQQAVTLNGGQMKNTASDFMNHVYQLYNKTGAGPNMMTHSQQERASQGIERFQKAIEGDQSLMKNTPSFKNGLMKLADLMKQSAELYNKEEQHAQQHPSMTGGAQFGSRPPIDLTPLIDPSRRQPAAFSGQQRDKRLREELLKRGTASYV